jgi:hypothetical protein
LFGVTSIRIERRGGVAASVPQALPALVSSRAECYPMPVIAKTASSVQEET